MTCPLDDNDCAILDRNLKSCSDVTCAMQKLRDAGLNMDEQQGIVDYHQRVARALKAIYFPDRQ